MTNTNRSLTKTWYFYHLGLFNDKGEIQKTATGNTIITYRGVTNDLMNRLREENGIIKGKCTTTKKYLGLNQSSRPLLVWKWIYYIPFENESICKSFETFTKTKGNKTRHLECDVQKRKLIHQQFDICPAIQNVLKTINMSRFESRIPSWSIYWSEPSLKPSSLIECLPNNSIHFIHDLSYSEKEQILSIPINQPKANAWFLSPY